MGRKKKKKEAKNSTNPQDILTNSFVLEIIVYTPKRSFHFTIHHHNICILHSLISSSYQRNTVRENKLIRSMILETNTQALRRQHYLHMQ